MSRVLIVDAKEDNRYHLRVLLEGHGWLVEEARHGEEALTKARLQKPDLIISDLWMPVMDGYTLLRNWKSDSQFAATPFVIFTATHLEPSDERLARDLGADAFLVHPMEPEPLLSELKHLAGREQLRRLHPPRQPSGEETQLLEGSTEILVRTLKEDSLRLERSNRALQDEIAARKITEDALRGSVHFFRSTIDALALHLAILDEAGRILAVNRAWRDFAAANGIAPVYRWEGIDYLRACEEATGDDTETAHAVADGIRAVISGKLESYSREYACHSPSELRWFTVRVTPFTGEGPARVVLTHELITNRKLAEEAVRRSENLLRTVTECISDPIFLKDRDSRILLANPATLEALGKTYDNVLGKSADELHEDVHLARVLVEHDQRVMESGVAESFEEYVPGVNGTRVFLSTKSPFRDADGRVIGVVVTARDITERKRAEDLLRLHHGEIAHLTRLNTVGEMAALLAHEISQPLHAIGNYVGGLERLLASNPSWPQATALARAVTSMSAEVQRAAAIITRLREFIRSRDVQRSRIDILQSINRAIELMTPLAGSKSAHLHSALQSSGTIPDVWADPIEVEQVVANLIANAIDAVSDRPPADRDVRLYVALSSNALEVETVVRDAGSGIPASIRNRLFQPFVSTKKDGLGVGLTICRSIVESHGGKIWVVHHDPYGTAFHFTLPVARVEKESQDGS
jgi:two-component system, LuxR family, sensor kinase FixL